MLAAWKNGGKTFRYKNVGHHAVEGVLVLQGENNDQLSISTDSLTATVHVRRRDLSVVTDTGVQGWHTTFMASCKVKWKEQCHKLCS